MKIRYTILIGLLLILLATNVSAAVTVTESTGIIFEADYSSFREDQELITERVGFRIDNTEVTDQTVTIAVQGLPANYNVLAINPVTIAANSQQNVQFDIEIPHANDVGEQAIGEVVLTNAAGTEVDRVNLIQDTKSMLIIEKIEVEYRDEDDKKQEDEFDAEDDNSFTLDDKVKIGTEVIVRIDIKNIFSDEDYDDSEIENIELKIDADDSDFFPDGFDDEYTFSDLKADDEDTYEFKFTIPDDIDAGDYTLELELEGEDGQNVKYDLRKEIDFDLERLDDDLRITKAGVIGTVDTCSESFLFDVEVRNYGVDDQEDMGVSIVNNDLRINEVTEDIEIEEYDERGDTWSNTYTINLPSNLRRGTYPIDVNVQINNRITQDFRRVNLEIESCSAPIQEDNNDQAVEEEQKGVEENSQEDFSNSNARDSQAEDQKTETESNEITGSVVQSVENPVTANDMVFGMLIVAIVMMIAVIGAFIVVLFRK